uniref:Uncharacterized protein n=1 Tax=Sus scrofa TaxID=9823 RepID=A0A8D0ZVW6_PIG
MLIMCLFSLSAILAPVLIAIYILQPFTLGKEPTLMVPNWQNGAVKRLTICCLLRGAWSALQPVCARVCICVPACASVCPHVCVWYAGGGRLHGAHAWCVRAPESPGEARGEGGWSPLPPLRQERDRAARRGSGTQSLVASLTGLRGAGF